MRRVLTSAGLALIATATAAAQGLTIDWSRTVVTGGRMLAGVGPDGATVLELRAAGPGGTSFHLVTIDQPPVGGAAYVVTGRVRYVGVEGRGYLEMWNLFPDGQRFFSRTLGTEGTLAALSGGSGWREFELPFDPGTQTPSRLEVNARPAGVAEDCSSRGGPSHPVPRPGSTRLTSRRGTVWLGPLRLEQSSATTAGRAQGAWWSERFGALFGAMLGSCLGVVGAIIGVLGGRGRARRLVLTLLVALIAVGGSAALLAAAAMLSSQPRYVWYPLLLLGVLSAVVGLVLLRPMKVRYAADELRRIQAMDARGP